MAWEDIAERMEGWGWLGAGVGAVLLAPAVIPALGRGLRPVAKGAIKGYLSVADRAREMFGETTEQWQDIVAEAKAEHEHRVNGSEMMSMELPAAGEQRARRASAGAGESPAAEESKSRSRTRREEEPKTESAE